MQRVKQETTQQNRLTPSKLIGMIRMLPTEHQYRVFYNNPGFGGLVCCIPKDGIPGNEPEMLFCNTEENMKKAIDFKCKYVIEESKSLSECFWHLNKPYRIQMLQILAPIYEMNGEYEKILKDAWTSTEFPHQATVDSLIYLFERADRDKLMTDEEKEVLSRLPEEFTVYRGYSEEQVKKGLTKRRGLAWTTEKKMAVWFATRYNQDNPKLATATIRKSDVYMYTNCRGEREMVLNPRRIRNLSVREVGKFD